MVGALTNLRTLADHGVKLRKLSEASDLITSLALNTKTAAQLVSDLAQHVSIAPTILTRREQIERRIAELQRTLATRPSKDELTDEVAKRERLLSQSRASRDSIRSLRNEAIDAALRAHAHQGDDAACPACGHDWQSKALLEEALHQSLRSLPFAEAQLLSNETAIASEVLRLEDELAQVSEAEVQLQQMLADHSAVVSQIQLADSLAARLGLGELRLISDATVEEWKQRVAIAGAYGDFVAAATTGSTTHMWSADHTPEEEIGALRAVIATLQEGIAERTQQIEAIAANIEMRDLTMKQLVQRLSVARQARDEFEGWNRQIGLAREGLGLGSIKEPHLDDVERALRARRDSLRIALQHLRSAAEVQTKTVLAKEAEKSSQAALDVAKKIEAIENELVRIDTVDRQIESQSDEHLKELIDTVGPSVSQLFQRMQVNRVFDSVTVAPTLELSGLLSDHALSPHLFSTGQRQDLAVAFFLVRAYALGGSFFLDEPLAHLDDLNRVAVLDTLRAFVLSGLRASKQTRLVLTTASWTTTRHVIQKFMRIEQQGSPLLRAYQLTGNVSTQVAGMELFPNPSSLSALS